MNGDNGRGADGVRIRPALLQGMALASWGGTIAADAAQADDRIWLPLLGAALLASWAAVQDYLIDRASQAANAMARAALTRPFDRDSGPMPRPATGPLARITGPMARLSLLDGPAHAAVPAARHRQRGQHANR